MKNLILGHQKKSAGIYKITCTLNGKVYIGSTINFMKRFSGHSCSLRRNSSNCGRLQRAYNKYGVDNFTFSVLCEIKKLENESAEAYLKRLLIEEANFIRLHDSNNRLKGLNIRIDPSNNLGIKLDCPRLKPDETIALRAIRDSLPKYNIGSNSPKSVINENAAREVKLLLAKGLRVSNIAGYLNISKAILYTIKYNTAWTHVEVTQSEIDNYRIPDIAKGDNFSLDVPEIKMVKYLLFKGHHNRPVSWFLTGRKTIVRAIETGKSYPNVSLTDQDIIDLDKTDLEKRFINYLQRFEVQKKQNQSASAKKNAKRGSKAHLSRLTESDVLQVKEMLLNGETLNAVANKFHVDFSSISCIKRGKTWAHLTGFDKNPPLLRRNTCAKITERDAVEIAQLLQSKVSQKGISESLGVSFAIVNAIASGKTWKDVTGIPLKQSKRLLNKEEVLQIKALLMLKTHCSEIALKFNVSPTTVEDIKYGRTWGGVTGIPLVGLGTPKGETNHSAKLTDKKILEIKDRLLSGESQSSIARSIGISVSRICTIKQGDAWSHITGFVRK